MAKKKKCYLCPSCNARHDNYEEARFCDCTDVETEEVYFCEDCEDEFDTEEEADECCAEEESDEE